MIPLTEGKYLRIVADTNDANYVERWTPLNYPEDSNYYAELEKVVPRVLEGIKKKASDLKEEGKLCNFNNWPCGEYCREVLTEFYSGYISEEDLDFFNDLLPYGEYGIHTIESIEVVKIAASEIRFKNGDY